MKRTKQSKPRERQARILLLSAGLSVLGLVSTGCLTLTPTYERLLAQEVQRQYQEQCAPIRGTVLQRIQVWRQNREKLARLKKKILQSTGADLFNAWYKQEQKDMDWLQELPTSPRRLFDENGKVKREILDSPRWQKPRRPFWLKRFHPGAVWELRSKPTASGAGQQCTYDAAGHLITSGLAAGTADKVSPRLGHLGLISRDAGHFGTDIDYWKLARILDGDLSRPGPFMQKYWEIRPVNGVQPIETYVNHEQKPRSILANAIADLRQKSENGVEALGHKN